MNDFFNFDDLKKHFNFIDMDKSKSFVKAVKIESVNNALNITVFICVEADADVCAVAEAVQQNVKEKVQNLTGSAVTKVTVNVADVDFAEE